VTWSPHRGLLLVDDLPGACYDMAKRECDDLDPERTVLASDASWRGFEWDETASHQELSR